MNDLDLLEGAIPKFYGTTTMGERGQVVIPAEARRELNLMPATKLMVFGGQGGRGLMLTKTDDVAKFLSRAMSIMTRFEQAIAGNITPTEQPDSQTNAPSLKSKQDPT